uniref:S-methyl-5'-thioadenosine phosphorylase n=1 Tax=Candidatus Methanogaster sp. ANME-2c ERB4 TaxID=2759911 RepID=A0A7G9YQJ2_9EURY|nr:S-methyl-5'-thioadenosine phosphorylase [Methanosarcinales archaeon ANME-2c ERB4]
MLGIITGTNPIGGEFEERIGRTETVGTEYGDVEVSKRGNAIFLPRHGIAMDTPPHRINHRANISALKESGVDGVVCVCSTASLNPEILPGTLVVPHDYINFGRPLTFYDDEIRHIVPALDKGLRSRIVEASHGKEGGVYVQMHGPRFETKAEIRVLGQFADIVGMTMANEATLCCEAGIPVAALCTVDNYANGVAAQEPGLSYEAIIGNIERNRVMVTDIIMRLIR